MANNLVQVVLVIGIMFLHSRQKRQQNQVFEGVEVDASDDVDVEYRADVLKKWNAQRQAE